MLMGKLWAVLTGSIEEGSRPGEIRCLDCFPFG